MSGPVSGLQAQVARAASGLFFLPFEQLSKVTLIVRMDRGSRVDAAAQGRNPAARRAGAGRAAEKITTLCPRGHPLAFLVSFLQAAAYDGSSCPPEAC